MALSVGLLGRTDVAVDGEPIGRGGTKERALLAVLALRRYTSVTVEQLLDLAWPDGTGSRGTLHVHIHNLRRRLGKYGDHLASSAAGYRLQGPALDLDLDRLARLALLVAECDGAGDHAALVRHAREAEALFRGELCEDLSELAVDADRRHYAEQRLALIERRIQAELSEQPADCIPELEALVVEHPFRERLWGLLMVALYRGQRQAEALATYRRAREVLLDEVGVEPAAELRSLEQSILEHGDPLALLTVPAAVTSAGPVLLWLDGNGTPRRRPLPVRSEMRIGRMHGSDVWLPEDDTVSRRHAVIRRTGSGWEIEDLDSLNGTLVNGTALSTASDLDVGDLVRCGSTMLLVTAPAVVVRPTEGDSAGRARSTQQARRPALPAPRNPPSRNAPAS